MVPADFGRRGSATGDQTWLVAGLAGVGVLAVAGWVLARRFRPVA